MHVQKGGAAVPFSNLCRTKTLLVGLPYVLSNPEQCVAQLNPNACVRACVPESPCDSLRARAGATRRCAILAFLKHLACLEARQLLRLYPREARCVTRVRHTKAAPTTYKQHTTTYNNTQQHCDKHQQPWKVRSQGCGYVGVPEALQNLRLSEKHAGSAIGLRRSPRWPPVLPCPASSCTFFASCQDRLRRIWADGRHRLVPERLQG